MREIKFDSSKFDPDPASHPQGKNIIDRGDPRFDLSEGRYRGPLAVVGTTRHLAVAAWTRQRVLWGRAGFTGAHPALAIATVEPACRYVLKVALEPQTL